MDVETFNNGRLGLLAAVWLHVSKSVSAGLAYCSQAKRRICLWRQRRWR